MLCEEALAWNKRRILHIYIYSFTLRGSEARGNIDLLMSPGRQETAKVRCKGESGVAGIRVGFGVGIGVQGLIPISCEISLQKGTTADQSR